MPNRLFDHIRRAALLQDGGGLTDRQLLALFVMQRDGDAFAALLKRHGPMVMGVCRRVLLNAHDAEDAFQATFLLFARKAASITTQDALGGWLYRVAYRTALEARARNARRRSKEQQVNDAAQPASEPEEERRELLALLDKELDRLPDKYRVPVVLCELQGKSRKEAARMLRIPEGTLSWRLAQAKKLLARRLSRYGVAAVAALLAEGAASAQLSPILVSKTAHAVLQAGAVPAQVVALTEGVLKAMLLTKLKITLCAAGLMLLAGFGATGLTYRATAQQPNPGITSGTARESRPQSDDLESLRLEIEALRKSLQATRQRVKTLEGEVAGLKGHAGAKPATQYGNSYLRSIYDATPPANGERPASNQADPNANSYRVPRAGSSSAPAREATTNDPFAEAESALKKLRRDPNDPEATEKLERAVQRLKKQEKPKEQGARR